ncbi:MAG: YfhO family protein [Actinomycetota bacterium]|nr:YfhO family protein [Actinomycetota bacterium]
MISRRTSFAVAKGAAGPALIVGAVLVLLHGYAFGGKIANGDLPTFWLPTFCYLGRSLASGHIPTWNPYAMGGVPFAADPQSGWMYAPSMLLFSSLPCDVAIRWMVVLQPIIAGLGIYWFLRSEGTGKASATVGGLVLALGIAGSQLSNSLPLSAALAWTAASLACCSRFFRATRTSARILWALATALAWGQLAAAHLSIGMLMGSGLIASYALAKAWDQELVARVGSRRSVLALAAVLPALFVLVNVGYLLPRVSYLPGTSLGLGYSALEELSAQLSGFEVHRPVPASSPTWPLKLATTPGAHSGAVALGLVFVPILSARFRSIMLAFVVFGALAYVLTLRVFATSVERRSFSSRVADTYLHSPEWWGYGLLIVVAVLAGLGMEAWRRSGSSRSRVWAVVPAVVVWGALPPIFGASPFELSFFWGGAAAAAAVFTLAARFPVFLLAIPFLVAGELVASGLIGYRPPPFAPIPRLLVDRAEPTIRADAYVRPGPIDGALQALPAGRYMLQDVVGWQRLQADPRSPMFRIEHTQGYNPVQLRRYWAFVRKLSRVPLPYNLSLLHNPPDVALDLLQIRYVVSSRRPFAPSRRIVPGDPASIYEISRLTGAASVIQSWTVVRSSDEALQAVTHPSFNASRRVVLEEDPGFSPPVSPAGASGEQRSRSMLTYAERAEQEVTVHVRAADPSILLVRTPYDRNWKATIDGRTARVIPADYLIQGIPLSAGSHVVRLTYEDRSVGAGLVGSIASVGALVLLAVAVRYRERRR